MLRRSRPAKDKYRRLSKKLMSKRVKEKMCPWKRQLTSRAFRRSFISFGFSGHARQENRNSTCVRTFPSGPHYFKGVWRRAPADISMVGHQDGCK